MINFDDVIKEEKNEHNLNWHQSLIYDTEYK